MVWFTLDELRRAAGTDLGSSRNLLMSQERITAFAEATEDRQWIHVDAARSANGSFGATIAHGYLTLSCVPVFLGDLLDVSDAGITLNYGLNKVRFPAPVPVDSSIIGHGRLMEVLDVVGGVQTVTLITITSDRSEKPVCVAEVLTRFLE